MPKGRLYHQDIIKCRRIKIHIQMMYIKIGQRYQNQFLNMMNKIESNLKYMKRTYRGNKNKILRREVNFRDICMV
jgi:hypothetical protein